MKAKDGNKKTDEKLKANEATMKAYKDLTERGSKQESLTENQRDIIKAGWKRKRERKGKGTVHDAHKEEERWANMFKEIQIFGTEMKQALELAQQCDLTNVIHSAKMTRQGEAHKKMAQAYFAKAKGEVQAAVKERNSSGTDGGKHLSAAIGEQAGKPLTSVCRDRDTSDGGKAGQMTSKPADIDAIAKRA